MAYLKSISVFIFVAVFLSSCNDDFSHVPVHKTPRGEYAPNMYRSEAYEPLTQVTDKNDKDNYNSNPYNAYGMNVREPATNTVKRNVSGSWPYWFDSTKVVYLPYKIQAGDLELAAQTLRNPLDTGAAIVKDGEVLYKKFCVHCHGETGQGDGEVGKKLQGVPQYNNRALKDVPEGHIFHVITYGKGRMGAHAPMLNQEERWKIVRYVQTLQALPTE